MGGGEDERTRRKRWQQTPAPSRSGTVSVATTSPHTEFLDRRSGRLIRRSGDGGGGHHGRSVMDFCFCDGDFFVHKRGGGVGAREEGGLSKFKRLVCCYKRSQNFLMSTSIN